jgi:pyrroloquinoline quinone (PQQ) biosynthesis protein C
MKPLFRGSAIVAVGTILAGPGLAGAMPSGTARGSDAGGPALQQARLLVAEIRDELRGVEDEIRNHPYLTALEEGQVSRDNLRAFAGEQYNIIRSDLRSQAVLLSRFGGSSSARSFFVDLVAGETEALDLLLRFAAALGLDEQELAAYEPRPGAQTYPSYVAWLASFGNQADAAASFLVNFAVFGENTGRMAAALRDRYGLSSEQTAFFDFFAAPVPGFEEAALAVIAEGLEQGAEPRLVKRSARLLQAYEKDFWDTVAQEPSGP